MAKKTTRKQAGKGSKGSSEPTSKQVDSKKVDMEGGEVKKKKSVPDIRKERREKREAEKEAAAAALAAKEKAAPSAVSAKTALSPAANPLLQLPPPVTATPAPPSVTKEKASGTKSTKKIIIDPETSEAYARTGCKYTDAESNLVAYYAIGAGFETLFQKGLSQGHTGMYKRFYPPTNEKAHTQKTNNEKADIVYRMNFSTSLRDFNGFQHG